MGWTQLAEDRNKWQCLLNKLMNLPFQ